MKTKMMIAAVAAATLVSGAALAAGKGDKVMTKLKDGTYVVNVVALPNKETPKIFAKVKSAMLPKYAGKKTSAVSGVDGVTGATYSSKAVKANVEAAVKYYKAHK